MPCATSTFHALRHTLLCVPYALSLWCSWAPLLFVWSFFTFWVFVCLHIVEGVAYVYNGVWLNGNEGMFAIAWTAYIGFVTAVAGEKGYR